MSRIRSVCVSFVLIYFSMVDYSNQAYTFVMHIHSHINVL